VGISRVLLQVVIQVYFVRKLLAIGSILNFACENDVIWGSGILNPSFFPCYLNSTLLHTLDIRVVRGPRTRNVLISKFNLTVPEIYGDPIVIIGSIVKFNSLK
jgi:pyruvyltransferase